MSTCKASSLSAKSALNVGKGKRVETKDDLHSQLVRIHGIDILMTFALAVHQDMIRIGILDDACVHFSVTVSPLAFNGNVASASTENAQMKQASIAIC